MIKTISKVTRMRLRRCHSAIIRLNHITGRQLAQVEFIKTLFIYI